MTTHNRSNEGVREIFRLVTVYREREGAASRLLPKYARLIAGLRAPPKIRRLT
jgi:hypothetical protein